LRIHVNGQPREVEDNPSLPELIASLDLKPEQIAIELNQTVIRRMHWQSTILREDDKVEIVHFVGGGFEGRRQVQ
jgi:thiamine biosynthesis protein ThiS